MFGFEAQAFVTSCITYDVQNIHPYELRVPMHIKCMRKGSEIWIDGGIDPYLIDELRVYNDEPIKTIYLNSGGGKVEDAFEIAQFIYDNKITTVVRKQATCASACTLLFQAGHVRKAHSSARFMYHSARFLLIGSEEQVEIQNCLDQPNKECMGPIEIKKADLMETTSGMFDIYEMYGASPQLREDYFNLPEESQWWESGNFVGIIDWWVTARTLTQYDVVSDIYSQSSNGYMP